MSPHHRSPIRQLDGSSSRRISIPRCRLAMTALIIGTAIGMARVEAGTTERVSVDPDGKQSNGYSDWSSISDDGRYVAFSSDATNLVPTPPDTNNNRDIFVYDRLTKKTTRMSVGPAGAWGDGMSHRPVISGNGRHVAFSSRATTLVANDSNGFQDIFVHDRDPDGNGTFDEGNGVTSRVSLGPGGAQAIGADCDHPVLSATGRFVAFDSFAANLVSDDTNNSCDIFVHDRDPDEDDVFDEGNGVTVRVSVSSAGIQGNNNSYFPSISANGRYVAFQSDAWNLVTPDGNWRCDIFIHDRDPDANGVYDEGNGLTTRISNGVGGAQANGNSHIPGISADGRHVAYYSNATNLVIGDTNNTWDFFVHDLDTGITDRVSVATSGAEGDRSSEARDHPPAVSANGQFVVFDSYATNLVADDTNEYWDVFIRDRGAPDDNGVFRSENATTTRVSVGINGAEGNYESKWPAITPDGRYVTFTSSSNSFILGDTGQWDIFVHDRQTTGTPTYRPDLLAKAGDELAYVGDNVFNADGAGQVRSRTASVGIPATYVLALQNDGNQVDAFRVAAAAVSGDWTVRYYDAAIAGNDITAAITSPSGYTTAHMTPVSTSVFRVEVTPTAGIADGEQTTILVTATSITDPAKLDAVRVVTTAAAPSAIPIGRTYTLDADFDEGALVGVEHETVHDQLQLTQSSATFPFIWVPNSNEGTVSKVDTLTGREMGRYRVCPETVYGNPSRTTVDLEGSCWVGNRQCGTVVKIGLLENGGYLDRNGNGLIDTSQDVDGNGNITGSELLPWGQDECVMWEVVLVPGYAEGPYVPGTYPGPYVNHYWDPGPRGLAVDAKNNVWVGTWATQKFYYLDGASAQIRRIVDVSLAGHTSYGAVIDNNGIVWSSAHSGAHVLWLDPSNYRFGTVSLPTWTYGLGLDRANHLFISGYNNGKLYRVDCNTKTFEWGQPSRDVVRGVTVTDDGDVWTADSDGMNSVTRFSNNGVQKTTIPVGVNPTGVAVDAAGKVWVVNTDDQFIRRIDPATNAVDLSKRILNGSHYGYSDMTGIVCRSTTTRMGNWTVVHDARAVDTPWGTISWTADTPGNTSVQVKVRSSNDRQRWSDWVTAANGAALTGVAPGRFLEVRATLQSLGAGVSPVLYDLTVTPATLTYQPDGLIRPHRITEYVGDDLYNNSGDSQTATETTYNERAAIYYVRLCNDGNFADDLTVVGASSCSGWTVTYFDAQTGEDITGSITQTGSSTGSLRAGYCGEIRIEVVPGAAIPISGTCEVLVTATSAADPGKSDTVKAVTICDGPEPPLTCRIYTLCTDFDEGNLVGLDCVQDQLQLKAGPDTFPFIWVPNSNEGTVSKVDTRTGQELGRYRTGPTTTGSPSRTTVDQHGNCWVGNRGTGTVVRIGLFENGGYVDRNGNGMIDTSRDLNGDDDISSDEMLPWGEDECVLDEIVLTYGLEKRWTPGQCPSSSYSSNPVPRAIAVDADGNIWAGAYGTARYYKIDGRTGEILNGPNGLAVNHNPYGAVIGADGILWSASGTTNILRLDTRTNATSFVYPGHITYGLGINGQTGRLYVSGWSDSKLSQIDTTVVPPYLECRVNAPYQSRGVAVTSDGDVWTAGSYYGTVTRWRTSTISGCPEPVATISVGNTPTGVAVDDQGKVWVVNYGDEYIHRIDPATNTVDLSKRIVGGYHYGYSDMTGVIARTVTTRTGTWTTTYDSRVLDRPWGSVHWSGSEPAGTRIAARVRSSNDPLHWSAWEDAENGRMLRTTPPGRFVQIQATLQRLTGEESPVLYDLSLCPTIFVTPDFDRDGDVDQDDLTVFESCATGPGVAQLNEACDKAKLDTDDDVDQIDFGVFQRCLSGENVPASPGCSN